jgi:hypothetical protein
MPSGRTRHRAVRALLLALGLAPVATAQAAEPASTPSDQAADDARRTEAKDRYQSGVDAYTSGHFKDAVDLFLAADRLSPSAPLSFNIARAYEKLGDDSGALRWYRDYLRRSPDAPNAKDVAAIVVRLEGRLAKKGVQQLTLLSTPAGATVTIDDVTVGITPGTFELPPGRHHVVLILRGYSDAASDVELAADHAQDVSLRLTPAPQAPTSAPAAAPAAAPAPAPAAPKAPAAAHESAKNLGVWPWVVLGAGGAVLGGAVTFELLRQSAERNAEQDATQIGYKHQLDTMQSRRTTARVLAGVGGALVVAGGVMLTLDLVGRKSKPAAALYLAPVPGGFAAALGGAL